MQINCYLKPAEHVGCEGKKKEGKLLTLHCFFPFPAPSGPPNHPHVEERQTKEFGKAKRNRTIKISKAKRAPEKWKAPFLREIANASELKYLDEFLLNKVRDGSWV